MWAVGVATTFCEILEEDDAAVALYSGILSSQDSGVEAQVTFENLTSRYFVLCWVRSHGVYAAC